METTPVDIFLELKDQDGNTVEGETLDKDFSKIKAIEISEFKLDGRSKDSPSKKKKKKKKKRGSRSDDEDDDDESEGEAETDGSYCTFEISKTVDKSSTALLLSYCWTVSNKEFVSYPKFASARITVRKSGGGQLRFLMLTFEDVSVVSYSLDVKSESPEESMTFKFDKVVMNYFPQESTGKTGVMCSASWDFQEASSGQ
jgi:type VI protein secretion system component Hcp